MRENLSLLNTAETKLTTRRDLENGRPSWQLRKAIYFNLRLCT